LQHDFTIVRDRKFGLGGFGVLRILLLAEKIALLKFEAVLSKIFFKKIPVTHICRIGETPALRATSCTKSKVMHLMGIV
jgi:hypothetical protein